LSRQRDVAQHWLAGLVLGPDVVEDHPTLDRRHLDGVRRILQVWHQIDEAEDPLTTGDGALHVGPHRGYLRDRLIEALGVSDESHDQSERYRGTQHALAGQQPHSTDAG